MEKSSWNKHNSRADYYLPSSGELQAEHELQVLLDFLRAGGEFVHTELVLRGQTLVVLLELLVIVLVEDEFDIVSFG